MDDDQQEPGGKAAHFEPSEFQDGPASADGGQLPPVGIMKRFPRFTLKPPEDGPGQVFPLLLGHGSDARKGKA